MLRRLLFLGCRIAVFIADSHEGDRSNAAVIASISERIYDCLTTQADR